MNLKELKSPIRIYWDVDARSDNVIPHFKRICRDIVDNKVLSLHVQESGASLSRACFTILESLKHAPIALSLAVCRSALNKPAIELLRDLRVKSLFIRAASYEDLQFVLDLHQQAETTLPPGISFEVSRANCHDLPKVLLFCLNNGIRHLVLPMQRLMKEQCPFYLTADERRELARHLDAIDKPEALKMTIHDPFLWKTFYPSKAFPGGGCQAANTMLYISPEADVYPCPSMPIKLGNLVEGSLQDIISSAGKKDVRKMLLISPQECLGCNELDDCKGGCRGRAYFIKKELNKRDPACIETD